MLDFTKKHLFDSEQGKYKSFLSKHLETKSEYNAHADEEDDDGADLGAEDNFDTNAFGGSSFGDTFGADAGSGADTGFGGGLDGGFDGGFGGADSDQDIETGVRNSTDWQGSDGRLSFLSMLALPLYLMRDGFKSLFFIPRGQKSWVEFMDGFHRILTYVGVVSLVLHFCHIWMLFSTLWVGIISLVLAVGSEAVLFFLYKRGFIATFLHVKPVELSDSTEDSDSENEDGDGLGLGDDGLGGDDDGDEADPLAGFADTPDDVDLDDDEDEDDEDEDSSEDEVSDDAVLPPSKIEPKLDELDFKRELLQVFVNNSKYAGQQITDRKSLVNSFADYYLPSGNDFSNYRGVKERCTEYNNLAYALYKALVLIYPSFAKRDKDTGEYEKLTIFNIKRSPLLYIVEAKLPTYFTQDKIEAKMSRFNSVFKATPSDSQVMIMLESFNGRLVFKLVRLNTSGTSAVVTLGDILRFKGDRLEGKTAYQQYIGKPTSLPLLAGLENSEHPIVLDLQKETSGVIVGGSGAGKSWTTFAWVLNLLLANNPEFLNIAVIDKKNSAFWRQFSFAPHVIALHGSDDIMKYDSYIQEIEKERERRQAIFKKAGIEDIDAYWEKYFKRAMSGDKVAYRKMTEMPVLFVFIDEISATMETLNTFKIQKKDPMYDSLRSRISALTQQGRSAGIHLFQIGQRSVDRSIVKASMSNSSLKLGMHMETEGDFGIMFGKEVEKIPKPSTKGMGILSAGQERINGLPMVKTLTLGASNNLTMGSLIRVISIDWNRRIAGRLDVNKKPAGTHYSDDFFNRNKLHQELRKEVLAGEIYSGAEDDATPNLAFDIDKPVQQVPVMVNVPNTNNDAVQEGQPNISMGGGETNKAGKQSDIVPNDDPLEDDDDGTGLVDVPDSGEGIIDDDPFKQAGDDLPDDLFGDDDGDDDFPVDDEPNEPEEDDEDTGNVGDTDFDEDSEPTGSDPTIGAGTDDLSVSGDEEQDGQSVGSLQGSKPTAVASAPRGQVVKKPVRSTFVKQAVPPDKVAEVASRESLKVSKGNSLADLLKAQTAPKPDTVPNKAVRPDVKQTINKQEPNETVAIQKPVVKKRVVKKSKVSKKVQQVASEPDGMGNIQSEVLDRDGSKYSNNSVVQYIVARGTYNSGCFSVRKSEIVSKFPNVQLTKAKMAGDVFLEDGCYKVFKA